MIIKNFSEFIVSSPVFYAKKIKTITKNEKLLFKFDLDILNNKC